MSQRKVIPSYLLEGTFVYGVPPTGKLNPELLFTYPEEFSLAPLQQLRHFCFPYSEDSSAAFKEQLFCFTFTGASGDLLYGYCLQNSPATPGSQSVLVCIISRLAWFSFLYSLLRSLNDAYLKSKQNNDSLLAMLLELREISALEFSNPIGSKLELSLAEGKFLSLSTPNCGLPPADSELQTVSIFAQTLSYAHFLQLFASTLAERRIVVTSDDLGKLTRACHALDLLIFPFHWQHVFIPILPGHLLDYCSATMPYIVGVHRSLLPRMAHVHMEDHVWVDLDTNVVTTSFNDADIIPPTLAACMQSTYKKLVANPSNERVHLFLSSVQDMFVQLLLGYQLSVRMRPKKTPIFDDQRFLLTRPRAYHVMLHTIFTTQMFAQYIDSEQPEEREGLPIELAFGSAWDNKMLFEAMLQRAEVVGSISSSGKRDTLFSSMRKVAKSMRARVKGDRTESVPRRTTSSPAGRPTSEPTQDPMRYRSHTTTNESSSHRPRSEIVSASSRRRNLSASSDQARPLSAFPDTDARADADTNADTRADVTADARATHVEGEDQGARLRPEEGAGLFQGNDVMDMLLDVSARGRSLGAGRGVGAVPGRRPSAARRRQFKE